ncbi:MAG: OmpA family protein [Rubrivivax sp.]
MTRRTNDLFRPTAAQRRHASTLPAWAVALALAAATLVAAALPHASVAAPGAPDVVVHYREGQRVDPLEVAQLLGAASRPRSIRLLDSEPAAGGGRDSSGTLVASAASAGPAPAGADGDATPAGLSLPVRFAFGSADILPQARPQLDALADGILMLAPERVVSVEGHTDATGGDAYNVKLSRERALAVRSYLMQRGIDGARLKAVGYGESWPIAGSDPYAGANRRVQFRGT